jgi:hypothetical protein
VERPVTLAQRLAMTLGSMLERRISRRSAVSRAALAGSAFAIAPIRYLIRPVSAWAVIAPENCAPHSRCRDGYTAFCCEIEHGRNTCPPGTYVAGWWKCTTYRGGGLCQEEGVRYYLDCNRMPGHPFPGGCQCALGDCNRRAVDCNHFRYGQCNTQIVGRTEVVCRLVICQHPASVSGWGCNGTEMIDNRTCAHEAGCLEGLAGNLPGGAGV